MTDVVKITDRVALGGGGGLLLFAGPCAMEDSDTVWRTARGLVDITRQLRMPFVFKASFDKANRSSGRAPRGMGLERGLRLLQDVKAALDVPVMTDVHEAWQCAEAGQVADVLQIPAFLARQTDLLRAAAATGRVVNVKKPQFLAPEDMGNVVEKLRDAGCAGVLLCERGTAFGYHRLVVDMPGLVTMRQWGAPVVFDATHSVQRPGANGTSSGGDRAMVPVLLNAAVSVGVDGVFLEVHPCPESAISDAENQLPLADVRGILETALAFDLVVKSVRGAG